MKEAGYEFMAINTDFDEQFPHDLAPDRIAEHLASKKNDYYKQQYINEILITSDTIVAQGSQILEKPKNFEDAVRMLETLSGCSHLVMTGVCISDSNQTFTFHDTTRVYVEPLSSIEISYYIERHKPFDKAGAYGIQDWIGLTRISKIEGSYFNVMGLPIHLIYTTLKDRFGITPYQQ